MQRSLHIFLPLVLATACTSTPGGNGGSSSTSGGSANEVAQGYLAVLDALCGYGERCRSTHGPLHSSVDACEAYQRKDVLLNGTQYDVENQHYGVDAVALSACVAALGTAACADRVPAELLGCSDALAPRNPAQVGEACSVVDADVGAPRCVEEATHWCNAGATGCGICAERLANGEDCRSNDQCLSGFCNTLGIIPPNRCENIPSAKGPGEGCLDTAECRGNLVCAGPFLQKKCEPRATVGGMCSAARNGDLPLCTQDLMCVGGTCARLREDGASCQRDPAAASQAGCAGQCVFAAGTLPEGTCSPLTTFPGEGQACSLVVTGDGAVTPRCAPGLFTDDRSGPGCTCRRPLPAGSACLEDEACASRLCDGETGNMPGTCRALSQLNATCTRDADCESGYCPAGNTRTCQTRPSCQ